jgi:hypothetical protein
MKRKSSTLAHVIARYLKRHKQKAVNISREMAHYHCKLD